MYREFFVHSPLLALPLLALVIFITVYAMVLLRAFMRQSERDAALAALPLRDDEVRP